MCFAALYPLYYLFICAQIFKSVLEWANFIFLYDFLPLQEQKIVLRQDKLQVVCTPKFEKYLLLWFSVHYTTIYHGINVRKYIFVGQFDAITVKYVYVIVLESFMLVYL